MDGDRLRLGLPANRPDCYRLSRVLWALLKLLIYFLRAKAATAFSAS